METLKRTILFYCILTSTFIYSQEQTNFLQNMDHHLLTDSINFHSREDSLLHFKEDDKTNPITSDLNPNSFSLPSNSKILLKDSLGLNRKLKTKSNSFLKNQVSSLKPLGSVSIGYEYGVLPFIVGGGFPAGGFSSQGNVSFLLLNIPLELTYHYTSIKNVIGLNNYFRISYDADRYKEQLSQNLSTKNQLSKLELNKLQLEQQKTLQKIEYLNFLQRFPNYKIPKDTSKPAYSLFGLDSNQTYSYSESNMYDTSGFKNSLNDSLIKNYQYSSKQDSLSSEILAYKSKYDSITQLVTTTKQQIDQIKNIQDNSNTIVNPYLSKVQKILSGIRKFEIGLCHPSYSTFLVNNVPLQGINIEYAKNNNFVAFTYGTTINNLLFNTNTIQGTMQSARNLYNYFDFGNLEAGRKILCLKGGVGAKDDTHIFVGFLFGKGRTDYLHPHIDGTVVASSSKESNVVFELDGKYKFSEQLNVDLIFGKSSSQVGDLSSETINKSVNEIFSDFRSNAFLIRINGGIKKTNTKLTLTTRWVDPFFRSFGIGFLRSDNLRYEIKAEQQFSKKIKYTIAYRREEDNLLKLYSYKNTLQTINNSLNLKVNRYINIRLMYAPLFRELKSENVVIKDRNHISTVVLSYTPKPKKVNSQFNALYSRYIISGDSIHINFENFNYSHQFSFKSGFKTGMNISWFKNNLSDTLGNDTYLSVADIGYVYKNGNNLTVGGKMAYKANIEPQYGFIIKTRMKIYKKLFIEAEAEKILIGDYYNGLALWSIKKFPYYFNTRLTFNF